VEGLQVQATSVAEIAVVVAFTLSPPSVATAAAFVPSCILRTRQAHCFNKSPVKRARLLAVLSIYILAAHLKTRCSLGPQHSTVWDNLYRRLGHHKSHSSQTKPKLPPTLVPSWASIVEVSQSCGLFYRWLHDCLMHVALGSFGWNLPIGDTVFRVATGH
jgi:hypothetical protein